MSAADSGTARPAAPVLDTPAEASLRTPSLRRRLAAFLYEGVLLFGVVFIAGYLWSALVQQRNAMYLRHGIMGFLFVVLGVYFVWFWSHGGQTLAQKTWFIRVLRSDGRPLGQPQALARYIASWLWLLPGLALAYQVHWHRGVGTVLATVIGYVALYALSSYLHPRRQFWHDVLCGTQLVSTQPLPPVPAGSSPP